MNWGKIPSHLCAEDSYWLGPPPTPVCSDPAKKPRSFLALVVMESFPFGEFMQQRELEKETRRVILKEEPLSPFVVNHLS